MTTDLATTARTALACLDLTSLNDADDAAAINATTTTRTGAES